MSPERNPERHRNIGVQPFSLHEARQHYAQSWSEINYHLGDLVSSEQRNFIRSYFRAQLRVARGQVNKAQRIFEGLDKNWDYARFEDTRDGQSILAAVDLAVKGKTNWKEVQPAFVLKR